MANKNYGSCTPITAKIQKTTKGGITEPLLNVGGPVKMKMTSPAKQTRLTGAQIQERNAKRIADKKKAKLEQAASKPQLKPGQTGYYRQEKRKGRDADSIRKENYSAANGSSTGSTDPNYGKSPSSNQPTSQPVPDLLKGPEKRKFTKTITPKKKKVVTIETKRPSADIKIKATITPKVSEKKEKQIKRISDRAAKTRKKSIDALESGNLQRAKRLKGREQRLEKRASRKAKRAIRKSNR
jgi:hypothetical protein